MEVLLEVDGSRRCLTRKRLDGGGGEFWGGNVGKTHCSCFALLYGKRVLRRTVTIKTVHGKLRERVKVRGR
jgi:hypothetical protein